jgi:hypothetical protein
MFLLLMHICVTCSLQTVVELWRYGLARQDTSSTDGAPHRIDSTLTRTSSGIDTNILDDDLLMCISLCNRWELYCKTLRFLTSIVLH